MANNEGKAVFKAFRAFKDNIVPYNLIHITTLFKTDQRPSLQNGQLDLLA